MDPFCYIIKGVKKFILSLFLLISSLITLISCEPPSVFTDADLIISEIYFANEVYSDAIELYNVSEESLDLSEYHLAIYRTNVDSPTYEVHLEGNLESNECYIIASSLASEESKNIANLVSENYLNNGSYTIALYKGSSLMDIIGTIGMNYDYADGHSLVRKVDKLTGKNSFDPYDFIRYNPHNLDLLGNAMNTLSPEELLEGPKKDETYFSLPYSEDGLTGSGGIVKVSLNHNIDGDTTSFNYPSELLDLLAISNGHSMRYLNVNTPESTRTTDPWGRQASAFTSSLINANRNELYIQSAIGGALKENYHRLLGFVWAGDTLVNYALVLNGYSTLHPDEFRNMTYKGISYYSFMYNAELKAISEGLRVQGELDPYWDYENDVPLPMD